MLVVEKENRFFPQSHADGEPVLLDIERHGRAEQGPRTYRGRMAIDGSPREIVIKYATRGWPVAQMDPDGRQRHGTEWAESFQFRWRSRGRSRELKSGLCTWLYFEPCGPAEMFFDHRGVVQALSKCEVEIRRVY